MSNNAICSTYSVSLKKEENTLANNMLVYNCTTSMQNKPRVFITCCIWVEIVGKRVISLSKLN